MKFIKYWLPVIIYAILIFLLSGIPGREIPFLFVWQDVFFHALEYLFFALLIIRAQKAYWPEVAYRRRFLQVLLFVALYALSDEMHQAFVPGRCPSLVDAVIDSTGAIIANLFYR